MRKAESDYVDFRVFGEKATSLVPNEGLLVRVDKKHWKRVAEKEWRAKWLNGNHWAIYYNTREKGPNGSDIIMELHRFVKGMDPQSHTPSFAYKDKCIHDFDTKLIDCRESNITRDTRPNRIVGNYSLFGTDEETKPVKKEELVRYIRENGVPVGCVVAEGSQEIGWSLCASFDQFSKKKAKEIARRRAKIPYEVTFLKELYSEFMDPSDLTYAEIKAYYDRGISEYPVGNPKKHRFNILKKELESMKKEALEYFSS